MPHGPCKSLGCSCWGLVTSSRHSQLPARPCLLVLSHFLDKAPALQSPTRTCFCTSLIFPQGAWQLQGVTWAPPVTSTLTAGLGALQATAALVEVLREGVCVVPGFFLAPSPNAAECQLDPPQCHMYAMATHSAHLFINDLSICESIYKKGRVTERK